MKVSVDLLWGSAEADQCVNQTVEAFGGAFARACGERQAFERISRLAFGLGISHPICGAPHKLTASYERSTGTFYASAPLDYLSWVGESWPARVGAVASALAAAVAKIHKTRISPEERATVLETLVESRNLVSGQTPPELKQLAPVHLLYYRGETNPSISFKPPSSEPMADATMVTLEPSEIEAFLRERPVPPEPPARPFKLYRRAGSQLEYYEAWVADDGCVAEHWGVCGDRGETLRHAALSTPAQNAVLERLKSRARSTGFKSVPISRHAGLLVSRNVDGFGSIADLEERHALENYLNALTGWLGLGHCDGGSIGSGAVEAYCLVVDFDIAFEAIERELRDSPYSTFSISSA